MGAFKNGKEAPGVPSRFVNRYGEWLIAALVGLSAAALFAHVIGFDFIRWDDDRMLFENPRVSGLSAEQLKWMFTNSTYNRVYMPLGWLGFALTNVLIGTTSACHHAVGVVLHSVNSALVFLILCVLLRRGYGIRETRLPLPELLSAALGALLWAAHPLRVEAVVWVGARMHPQAGIFALLSVLSYLKATSADSAGRSGPAFHALSIIAYAASVASYPIAVMLPFCFLAIDYWIPASLVRPSLRQLLRLAAGKLFFLAGILPLLVVSIAGRLYGENFPHVPSLDEFGIFPRAMQAAYIWAVYLATFIYPFDLSVVEPRLTNFDPFEAVFIASAILVIVLTVGAIMVRCKSPILSCAWLIHLMILAPFLGLTEHPHSAANRYSYLDSVIWCALIAAGTAAAWRRIPKVEIRGLGVGTAVAIVIILGFMTHVQTLPWRNDLFFFGTMVEQHGTGPFAANIHWRLGRDLAERGWYDKAIASIEQSLKRDPMNLSALNLRAQVLLLQGKTEEADIGLVRYAEASWVRGKLPEALKVIRDMVSRNPKLVKTKQLVDSQILTGASPH